MKQRIIFILTISLLTALNVRAQNRPGYVQQETILVDTIKTDAQIAILPVTKKHTTRVYVDGLGRTLQSVAVQASPSQNDLIQPVVYDNLGRQTTGYLPYAGQSTDTMGSYRSNAMTAVRSFYNNTSQYIIARDTSPYSQQVFDNSPLQRLLQAGSAGVGFQPGQHYASATYRFNNTTADGNIMIWNPDGTFTTGNYYANATLNVTDNVSAGGAETLIFTDMAGRILLKRQLLSGSKVDTYYVYNNAGMIAYIIPPGALSLMTANNNYSLTQTGVNKLIFVYTYDRMGRLIQKTVPGKGMMVIVYDPLNRPVLMQDANMASQNTWNYIRYDVKNRPVSQGLYVDNTRIGRGTMQTYVNGLSSSYQSAWYETRSTSSATGYYTASIFPTTATGTLTPLAYAYFDSYDLKNTGSNTFSYVAQGLTNEDSVTTTPIRGVPTMTRMTTVGSGIAVGTWLLRVTFYDKRGNPIQTQSSNAIYNTTDAVTDYSTTVPDFAGAPRLVKVSKQTASSTTTVLTSISYDHMYRIMTVSQQYNGTGTLTAVASYSYNELGQVIKKGLGYVNSTTWLQNVDMRYNIRGQLLSINNSKLSNDGGVTNGDTNDVFGMQLLYDQPDGNLGNSAYYDGKLSAVKWMSRDASGNQSYERAYKYNYDQLQRYTSSNYAERTVTGTGSFTNNISGFDEAVTYASDNSGNISALTRNSSTQGTNSHIQFDNLIYGYDPGNPDQLHTVTDGSGTNYTNYGFRNLTGSSGSYVYDANNGNLQTDPYKGLSIGYNLLNRTDKITVTTAANRWVDYTYNATGVLIRKRQYDNNVLQNTTDYVDGFVYINNTLSYFPMPEGRVLNNGGSLTQEFIITDQQGNARVSFRNNGSGVALVTQENSYYATGLIMPNSPVATPTVPNKQLYNGGSEWQNDYGNLPDYYQTFNRNYDAAIARFISVDPVAESAESMTSYQYAGNNPVMMNDPLGDKIMPPINWWRPSNALHNGALEKFQRDEEAFWESLAVASTAESQAQDAVSDGGAGGYATGANGGDLFGGALQSAYGQLSDLNYNSEINNSVAYNAMTNISDIVFRGDYEYNTVNGNVLNGGSVGINDYRWKVTISADDYLTSINTANQGEHLTSSDVRVTFDPGANQLVSPRLANYFSALMAMAHQEGVNSVNISSTTNHPTNKSRSRHTLGLAFDINYINGVHVSNDPNSSIYGLIYDLFPEMLDVDKELNEQFLEFYSPPYQERWFNNQIMLWPSVAPEHQNHIHISLQ